MTCHDCQGEVNVSSHNGAKLRCGCGHTVIDTPRQEVYKDLRELIAVLRETGVQSYSNGSLTLVMSPQTWTTAVAPPPGASLPDEKPQACACGHLLAAEHTAAGCVHGCELTLCEQSMEAR